MNLEFTPAHKVVMKDDNLNNVKLDLMNVSTRSSVNFSAN